jgi:Transaldolase/Fructose-6-phosphate aldolase
MGVDFNPAQRLHALGQSLWLDSINRVMLRTGALARYVRDLAVTRLTSNPTILGHAMAAGSDYDRSLAGRAGDGVTGAQDLVYALALEDLAEEAALFRPEWERTAGVDGYVSLEVPPDVAYDAPATAALARRLRPPRPAARRGSSPPLAAPGSCRGDSSGPAEPGTGSCPGQPARLPRHRPPRRRAITSFM